MLLIVENILSDFALEKFKNEWKDAQWASGYLTAGSQAAKVKQNLQLDDESQLAKEMRKEIMSALNKNPQFLSAAIPSKIYPPKFNCYQNGGHYGVHVDNAILNLSSGEALRTDLSATIFLSTPESYDGGELVIETGFGAQEVKLDAGDMVLYPSTSLHQVNPVTRGARLASFFWIQSLIADNHNRSMLYDLDQSIQNLRIQQSNTLQTEIDRLTGVYHNLVRSWSAV